MPNDYVVIDIETTGLDYNWDEIIELAAIRYRNGEEVARYDQLVNPGFELPVFITELTGITDAMVAEAPAINEAIIPFVAFLGTDLLIGHNVGFDMRFVWKASREHLGEELQNEYIDTMRLSRKVLPGLGHHRLADVSAYYGISYTGAHRASVDCEITNQCYRKIRDQVLETETEEDFVSRCKKKNVNANDIKASTEVFDPEHPLYQKTVVFTGALSKMTRAEAMQLVVDCGGLCGNGVTKTTNYLVIGTSDFISAVEGKKTSKMIKVEQLRAKGFDTRAEAQRALERLTDVNVTEKFNMTFAQVYNALQPEMERKVSDKHIKGLKSAYNACPELHAQVFRILRRSDFQGVIIRLEQEGKSKSTCEKMRQLFSKMSKWALSEGIVQSNHAQYLDTVAKQKSVKRPLLQAEIDAIKASKNRGVPIVLILLGAGCRPNELFKVPLVNCHEDYFIGGSKTEAGENRIIMISSVGLQAYQELRAKAIRGKCARLIDAFEGNRDQHNFSKREFRDLMEETGITGVTMYNLRHTMITNAVRSGVDQRALQQMVGHAGAEITKNYTHLSADDLRKEINKIEEKTAVGYKLDTRSEARIQVLEKSS